ncbi:MAG TPA: DUF4231 domain-containing protein [Rhizomicrobium sp.]|nr:DUF4231 domain-containing protein [Rhizomicrobium sp.]
MDEQYADAMVLPRPQACLRVGVTGHRIGPKFSEAQAAEVRKTVDALLGEIARLAQATVAKDAWAFSGEQPLLSTVSALAEGADRIVADAGLAAGFPLSAILPFWRGDYRDDFSCEDSRAAFDSLLARANVVFELDGKRAAAARAYEAAGLLMLANADIVIAIWDQMPADGIGGTALIVEHAVAEGVPVILIDPRKPDDAAILWRADIPLPTARAGIEEVPRRSLSGLLPDMVSIMLAPPDGTERQSYQSLLAEKPLRWNIALAYPLLLFVAGVRRLRWSDLHVSDHRQDGATRWRDYLGADSRNAGLSPVVTEKLLGAYSWVDHLSIRYAQIYRSAYVFNFAAAAFAVLLALSSLLLPSDWKPLLLAFEIGLIGLIVAVIWRGGQRAWHRRWMEYRRLAETLRHLRILALMGAAARLDRPGKREQNAHGWVSWYARAIEREIPVPSLAVDEAYLTAVRDAVRNAELKMQIEYNRHNAEAMEKAGERLHNAGSVLFLATLGICIVYFALYFVAPGFSHAYKDWTVFLTALFPTVGAAINAIRAQGDFQSVADRSRETGQSLEELDAAMAQEPLEFARLSDRVDKAADLLMADVAEWHVLFRTRPLSLPA